jgi:hypothetical protein
MLFSTRPHSVVDLGADFKAAANKLTKNTWTACSGFRVGRLTLLNDSTGPDGAQEYAVFHDSRPAGVQIESLTVSWMTEERLTAVLERLNAAPYTGVETGPYELRNHPSGSCAHCA